MESFLSSSDLLLAFVPVFASVLALPGPNAAFAVGQSVKYGVVRSLFVPLGFMLATGIHAALVLSGLGVLVLQYASALVILKWLGVLYLLYLAYKAFTAKSSVLPVSSKPMSKRTMLTAAMLVSLTNPKALLASLMLYPLFIRDDGSYAAQSVALGLVAMLVSFGVYGGYVLAASLVRQRLVRSHRANKVVGAFYLGAAGALAAK